jgi:hypothetical protein
MGANRTSFLANRRLQPLGHLSGADVVSIKEEPPAPLIIPRARRSTAEQPSVFRRIPLTSSDNQIGASALCRIPKEVAIGPPFTEQRGWV